MPASRRTALRLIGGGTVAAATTLGAGGAAFVMTRTPSRALAPWADAGTYEEPRRRALSYAILAPNPHNLQPWLIDLRQPETVTIFRDPDRDLPMTDPFSRQITIGLGCFLELMSIAASTTGHAIDFDLFPRGDDGPVAVATFRDGAEPDPLARHILDRRSCKEPFEDRAVPAETVAALAPFADILDDPARVEALKTLTWAAWQVEAATPRTHRESVDLMRFGKAEIEANPDGIDLGGPFLETLMLAGLMDRDAMLDPTSAGSTEGVRLYREMLAATPAYAVLTTPTDTRADQIAAGRRWLRLNLKTTELGLALHPVSQALQEYPEMAVHYAEAHAMLAAPGHTVQMLGRLGFGPETPQTPRWSLGTRLTHG